MPWAEKLRAHGHRLPWPFRLAGRSIGSRRGNSASQKARGTLPVAHGRVEAGCLTLNDIPIAFGLRKRYEDRLVTILNNEKVPLGLLPAALSARG